ncbi:hypothetical protein C4A76_25385 [Brevibacillus laterosporus]|uniref:Uncharacterized protein n=1 Tax=Brevibacillus laterosporus TaxID=1465 RepID=A0AAP8Q8W4_BRELA|nr:hypothetical protein [Brevibacillus laterosporus]PPA80777.1 hypothetical protein C4A76_25385 [Brevibacillus laterosporus]PPA89671.1 hypothetical protein C4A77_25870 [Brevibacillus laterosporus]
MDEIAWAYFKQLERRLRSHSKLLEGSIVLKAKRAYKGNEIYQYRAIFKCQKTFKVRMVWIDHLGRIVSL